MARSASPPSSRSRSPPARQARRRPSARRSARTAWRSWTSSRPTTRPPSRRSARSCPSRSPSSRTARSRSSSRRHRRRCCCARRPASRRLRRSPAADRRPGHRGRRRRDRPDQDARPQRLRPRSGQAAGPWHRPLDGHRSRLTSTARPGRTSPGGHHTTRKEHHVRQEASPTPLKTFDRDQFYSAVRGARHRQEHGQRQFDESVDVAVRLGVDPRKADQMVRGTVGLPPGTGKDVRVAVFATGEAAAEAREAGADLVGSDDLAAQVEAGKFDFDVAIATPDMMPLVGRLGRALGPRGLMPNPKTGTVTDRCRPGGHRVQGRQGRVPHRPLRQHPRAARQGRASSRRRWRPTSAP